ncbi:MAG: DUF1385 domain-containing protein [candidate division Zixibacteria bacterium]|nr:DUF1385 domain-containing protein [candidate division Zixibacteria bacterium]
MSETKVGGQAVIEGVMIRSPERIATAVRDQKGRIVVHWHDYRSLTKRKRWLNIPVVRGAISFFEMLILGISSLNFSAEVATREDKGDVTKDQGPTAPGAEADAKKPGMTPALILTTVVGLTVGIFFFLFIPLWIVRVLGFQKGAIGFNLMAGLIRMTMFVGYVWALSFFRDFRRLFEYHGAEHMSIFAYENGEELTLENVRKYETFHPRCGTSFLFIVALSAILVYSISDSLYQVISGSPPPLLNRFLVHFLLLPFVAGSSFELLKASARHVDRIWWRILAAPGLWIQHITTRTPDTDQLEVARIAIWSSVGMPLPESVSVEN